MAIGRRVHLPNIQQAFSRAVHNFGHLLSRGWDVTSDYFIDLHKSTENFINWNSPGESVTQDIDSLPHYEDYYQNEFIGTQKYHRVQEYKWVWPKIAFNIGRVFHFITASVGHIFYDSILDITQEARKSYNLAFATEKKDPPKDIRSWYRIILGLPGRILGFLILRIPAAIDFVLGLNPVGYKKAKVTYYRIKEMFWEPNHVYSDIIPDKQTELWRQGLVFGSLNVLAFVGCVTLRGLEIASQKIFSALVKVGQFIRNILGKFWNGFIFITGLNKNAFNKSLDYYRSLLTFFFEKPAQTPKALEGTWWPGLIGGILLLGSIPIMLVSLITGINDLGKQKTFNDFKTIDQTLLGKRPLGLHHTIPLALKIIGFGKSYSDEKIARWRAGIIGNALSLAYGAAAIVSLVTGIYHNGFIKTNYYYKRINHFLFNTEKNWKDHEEELGMLRGGIFGAVIFLGSTFVLGFSVLTGLNSLAWQRIKYDWQWLKHQLWDTPKPSEDIKQKAGALRPGIFGSIYLGVAGLGAVSVFAVQKVGQFYWWCLKKIANACWLVLKAIGNLTLDVLGLRLVAFGKTVDYYAHLRQFFFNEDPSVALAPTASKMKPGILGFGFLALSSVVMLGGVITGLNNLAWQRIKYDWQWLKHQLWNTPKPGEDIKQKAGALRPGIFGSIYLGVAGLGAVSVFAVQKVGQFCWWVLKKIANACWSVLKGIGNLTLDVLGLRFIAFDKTTDYYARLRQFFFNDDPKAALALDASKMKPGILGFGFLALSSVVMLGGVITGLNNLAWQRIKYDWQWLKHQLWDTPKPSEDIKQKAGALRPGIFGSIYLGVAGLGALGVFAVQKVGQFCWWVLKKIANACWSVLKGIGNFTLDVLGLRFIAFDKTTDYYARLRQFFFNDDPKAALALDASKMKPGILGFGFLALSSVVMLGGVITGLNNLAWQRIKYDWQWLKNKLWGSPITTEGIKQKAGVLRPGLFGFGLLTVGTIGALGVFAVQKVGQFCWWVLKKIANACWFMLQKIGSFCWNVFKTITSGCWWTIKKVANFAFSCLKEIAIFGWNILANTFRVIGISSYSYHNLNYTLKKCANYLFNTNFDVACDLSKMKKIADQKNFGSFCSQIGILGWIAKGIFGTVTVLMAAIGLSATNWHRMHEWWINRTNEKLNEKSETDPENRIANTSRHSQFLSEAHGDWLSRFFSKWNVFRGLTIALRDYILPATFITATAIPIFLVRNLIYKPIKNVLKLLLLPFTCCCCPKPTTEMRQLVKDLNTFHNSLSWDGSLPGVLDPKTREAESKDQPGSPYAESVSDCYQRLTKPASTWSERICHWITTAWAKEIRIATSFALPNVEERVIAAFVDAIEAYSTKEGASLKGFLDECYSDIVLNVKNDFTKIDDKQTVDKVAWAVRFALIDKEKVQDQFPEEWKNQEYLPKVNVRPSAPYISEEEIVIERVYMVQSEPYRGQFGDASAPSPDENEVQLEEDSTADLPQPSAPKAEKAEQSPSILQRLNFFNRSKVEEMKLEPIVPHHLLLKFKV